MSLLFFDGFETEKNLDQKQEVHGWNPQYSITVDIVNSGTNALRMVQLRDNYNCVITKKIRPSSTVITGFAIRFEKISANVSPFFVMENKIGESPIPDYGRRSYIQLKFNSSSKIEAYFMGTLIGTGTKTINTNTQYYLENKLEFITSNIFQYTLKIDETTTDIYASRSDFITATDHVDYITFIASSGSETGGPYGMYLDDVYILDGVGLTMNNFLGKCIVLGSRVNEVGTFNDFTSYDGTSNKVDALREIIGDKNTYAYDHSMLSMQSFNLENISNAGNVYGVIVNQNIQKSTPRSETVCFSPFVKNIDGVEHYRDDVTLTDNDQNCYSFAYEVDPFTGVQQSTSSINTTEIGMKIVAEKNINRAQLTQLGVEPISKTYALNVKGCLAQAAINTLSSMKSIIKRGYITQGCIDIISKTQYVPQFILATGGTILYDGNYKVHMFTSTGDFTVFDIGNDLTSGNIIEVLAVGGGGGGSHSPQGGGGGGAGGVIYNPAFVVSRDQTIHVIVGNGGANYSTGQDSYFGNMKAFGGGASTTGQPTTERQGGSGGGGGHSNPGAIGGPSIQTSNNGGTGYGNAGGTHVYSNPYNCGSGGGANAAGTTAGVGGAGKSFNITGSTVYYAGGGGQVNNNGTTTAGGIGGGGAGGNNVNGGNGVSNTGGGGGGSRNATGGAGGSGVVIVRYRYK